MSTAVSVKMRHTPGAAWLMLLLWLVYTLVYTLPLEKIIEAGLEAAAGALGVLALLIMGFSRQELYLQVKSISPRGWIALGVATLALAAPLSMSRFQGVNWIPLLVYAPLSGITQELFFRASLLPAIQWVCGGRKWTALVLHALLFGLWHVPLAFLAAPATISPWLAVISLFVVTSLAGLAWGWQAQNDRTVVWTMLHHTLLLMVMSLFGL